MKAILISFLAKYNLQEAIFSKEIDQYNKNKLKKADDLLGQLKSSLRRRRQLYGELEKGTIQILTQESIGRDSVPYVRAPFCSTVEDNPELHHLQSVLDLEEQERSLEELLISKMSMRGLGTDSLLREYYKQTFGTNDRIFGNFEEEESQSYDKCPQNSIKIGSHQNLSNQDFTTALDKVCQEDPTKESQSFNSVNMQKAFDATMKKIEDLLNNQCTKDTTDYELRLDNCEVNVEGLPKHESFGVQENLEKNRFPCCNNQFKNKQTSRRVERSLEFRPLESCNIVTKQENSMIKRVNDHYFIKDLKESFGKYVGQIELEHSRRTLDIKTKASGLIETLTESEEVGRDAVLLLQLDPPQFKEFNSEEKPESTIYLKELKGENESDFNFKNYYESYSKTSQGKISPQKDFLNPRSRRPNQQPPTNRKKKKQPEYTEDKENDVENINWLNMAKYIVEKESKASSKGYIDQGEDIGTTFGRPQQNRQPLNTLDEANYSSRPLQVPFPLNESFDFESVTKLKQANQLNFRNENSSRFQTPCTRRETQRIGDLISDRQDFNHRRSKRESPTFLSKASNSFFGEKKGSELHEKDLQKGLRGSSLFYDSQYYSNERVMETVEKCSMDNNPTRRDNQTTTSAKNESKTRVSDIRTEIMGALEDQLGLDVREDARYRIKRNISHQANFYEKQLGLQRRMSQRFRKEKSQNFLREPKMVGKKFFVNIFRPKESGAENQAY